MMVDWSVNSGPQLATAELQRIVGATPDGKFGSKTLVALLAIDDRSLTNLLVAARIRMIGRIVQKRPSQLKFVCGWLQRALEFLH